MPVVWVNSRLDGQMQNFSLEKFFIGLDQDRFSCWLTPASWLAARIYIMADWSGKFYTDNYIYPELQFIYPVRMTIIGTYECGGALSIYNLFRLYHHRSTTQHLYSHCRLLPPSASLEWQLLKSGLLGRCLCMPMFLKTTPVVLAPGVYENYRLYPSLTTINR